LSVRPSVRHHLLFFFFSSSSSIFIRASSSIMLLDTLDLQFAIHKRSHFNHQTHYVRMTQTYPSSCHILWSTQSGRAKACARRTARILKEQTTLEIHDVGSSFDDSSVPFLELAQNIPDNSFLLLFVSTTGDGEHCDAIRTTWKRLLSKSIPANIFQNKQFAMFCLGDRAYGPQFCAAGRKLAVRLLQLGMTRKCEVGYGDDDTPNGGVFYDLDDWLQNNLLPILEAKQANGDHSTKDAKNVPPEISSPYQVLQVEAAREPRGDLEEWQQSNMREAYQEFFTQSCPITAYSYNGMGTRIIASNDAPEKNSPLLGRVLSNQRLTGSDWEQDTRHIQLHLEQQNGSPVGGRETAILPYEAGDIATILPCNSDSDVNRFLQVLPQDIEALADYQLDITIDESRMNSSFCAWPKQCTFRGWLKYCADLHSLPEREDLRALSPYCSHDHSHGKDQSAKLLSLSETSEAALFADYILREKRCWPDLFYDFDSLRAEGSKLTLEALLTLLPPIRPRHFSIASAPSTELVKGKQDETGFSLDLCVAVVQGRSPLGRDHHGLCSEYLSRMVPSDDFQPLLQVWIRPGSFGKLPLEVMPGTAKFSSPILCIGAGTGIAPLRSLIQERDAVRSLVNPSGVPDENDNILVFGCRKQQADYYYKDEWEQMANNKSLRVLTAFSRDQRHKIYVMKVLREADNGRLIVQHILERNGAVYIAGGPKMARAVKEEIIEALTNELGGNEKQANQLLSKLQRVGKFSIEAWS
jgi:sulfite reductase alpha subunit-like flavoprotein